MIEHYYNGNGNEKQTKKNGLDATRSVSACSCDDDRMKRVIEVNGFLRAISIDWIYIGHTAQRGTYSIYFE